jgi:hypothetical protein
LLTNFEKRKTKPIPILVAMLLLSIAPLSRAADPAGDDYEVKPAPKVVKKDAKAKAKVGTAEDIKKATTALDDLFRAYETGNIGVLRKALDPSMIGFQAMLDGIKNEINRCKQMRITLTDTQIQAGPDLAVIQTDWQKRCLLLPNFSPQLQTGHANFLLHREVGGWSLANVTGSNPLTPTLGAALATITASSSLTCAAIGLFSTAAAKPFSISVNDPNRASASSVTISLTESADAETITLPAVGGQPGLFQVSTLVMSGSAIVVNDGVVEFPIGNGCPPINITYVGTTTNTGPQVLTTTVSFP